MIRVRADVAQPVQDAHSGQDVADRVVIVTGAGMGIGHGVARHLGRAGARVVISERDPDALQAASARFESERIDVLAVQTDVSDRASVDAMVAATMDRWGRIDGLVNNAMSVSKFVPLIELDDAALDTSIGTGLKGTLYAMQAVYPHMRATGWGRIVNVGSAAGVVGFKGMGAYGAAKEGIRALTRTAAREWAGAGITVNLFCPLSTGHHRYDDRDVDAFIREGLDIANALRPTDTTGTPNTTSVPSSHSSFPMPAAT